MITRRKKEPESNRRRWPRLNPKTLPFLKSVEFNQGMEAEIVNISRGGLLLETEARLRPDLKIMLKLVTTEGVLKMDGLILRSSIYSLKGIPRYRTAIAFKHPFNLLDDFPDESEKKNQTGYSETITAGDLEGAEVSPPKQRHPESGVNTNPAILTVVARDDHGICLQESFSLNDW